MAAENYIRDISAYLSGGNLSDLTLNLGERKWQIHKALACSHSKWFKNAVTGDYKENLDGVVTLVDDDQFIDAVDCMVSYFYEASYNVTKYDKSESLLHAQVASIADKYDCASLYVLAKTRFANTVNAVKSDDWIAIATLIYDYTTKDFQAHIELRDLTVAAVANRPAVLKTVLGKDSIIETLRSNADLATDLLLNGVHRLKVEGGSEHIFVCDNCQYAHAGSPNCSNVGNLSEFGHERVCPKCHRGPGIISKRYMHKVELSPAISCSKCHGLHTLHSELMDEVDTLFSSTRNGDWT